MKHFILVAVDCQYGFCEGGELPVNGGTKACENVNKLINLRIPNNNIVDELGYSNHTYSFIKEVIFTADAHPGDHCSFKGRSPEGQWPVHCVEDTKSAAIVDPLIMSCVDNGIPYGVVKKGQKKDSENYSAFKFVFKNLDMFTFSMAPDFDPTGTTLEFFQDPEDKEENYNEIIVAGLAGDYCVLETLKEFIKMDPIVYLEGIASIDGGNTLINYIKENKLRIIDSKGNISMLD